MTTIIWRIKTDWTIQLAWDKRTTTNNVRYRETCTKIIRLDDTLIGIAWDSIPIKLVEELHNKWKESDEWKEWLHSIIWCINFSNTIKENCNMKTKDYNPLVSVIFMNKDIQIEIDSSWQITHLKDVNMLSIGNWSELVDIINWVCTNEKVKYNIELEDYFEIISSLDNWTSKEFDLLEIIPDILIQTN